MQLKGLFQPISYRLIAGLTYFAVIALAQMSNSANADTLSDLSGSDQEAIARICLPLQYQQGADAYRECVTDQIGNRIGQTPTAIAALSFDEQYAVRQVCQPIGTTNDPAYQQCVNQQLDGLGQISQVQLNSFDNDEIYAVQQSCFQIQISGGVKAFRQCINAAAAQLSALPKPNLSELTLLERNALQLNCSAPNSAASDYRQCLLDAVGGAAVPSTPTALPVTVTQSEQDIPAAQNTDELDNTSSVETVFANEQTNTQPETNTPAVSLQTTNPQVAITDSSLTIAQVDTASNLTTEPDNIATPTPRLADATPAAEPVTVVNIDAPVEPLTTDVSITDEFAPEKSTSTAEGLWANVKSSAAGLNNVGRMIVAAALALPILLIGFWLLLRGRNQEPEYEYSTPNERNPLMDRVGPSQQKREMPVRDYDMPMDQTDQLNLSQQADDMFGEMPPLETAPLTQTRQSTETETTVSHPVDALLDTAPEQTHVPTETHATENSDEQLETDELPASNISNELGSTERAGLLAWLNHQPVETRQPLAIEFLIYWLAYGDDRYDPAMKEALFQLKDPDDYEKIKRWVLMQDIYAFSDVVYWLQHNATDAQKEQLLDLLMALLINENTLSPVQNTVLRFLTDAFGLGHEWLEARFKQAFGYSMPPLPRVDKPRWWDQQSADQHRRWDARAVSRQSVDIQNRVRLGLPLTGKIPEEDIIESFNRAAARCHPQRFDQLGLREQSLVERQFEKFEFVKDSLLEISV